MTTKTEALKQALEALKESQTDNDTMEFWERKTTAIFKCQEALAQPEQEPFTYYRHYDDGLQEWPDEKTIPLYTTLQKRIWVGLTDKQREQHRDDWRSNIHDKEFQAIEAKLKELNHD